ncbi:MAG TPA: methionine adenosyltransferase [Polyangiaceae bacterium]|nr:methionine adenosyltransferase [Polyangiaceae bacterium]
MDIVVELRDSAEHDRDFEVVERKGIGHPDTICDALAERFSLGLSRFYLERFGKILHHNVDKVLLRGGAARANFGGGDVLEPIEIYFAGRATTNAGGVTIPVEDIAVASAREWIRESLHAVDPERHVRVHCLVRAGSADLANLFLRPGEAVTPLANDTSVGVGYAPASPLELATVALERRLNSRSFIAERPAHGEDVKVMAVRRKSDVAMTIARAFVAQHVPSFASYREEIRAVAATAMQVGQPQGVSLQVRVNAADAADGSSVYLTVTGTSAECGDDGQVGRGNRANGVIAPLRPASMEALAGKNPVTHVGKLYNIVAREVAADIVASVPGVRYAECCLVSQIGAPIDEPAAVHVFLRGERGETRTLSTAVEDIARAHLAKIGDVSARLVAGGVSIY